LPPGASLCFPFHAACKTGFRLRIMSDFIPRLLAALLLLVPGVSMADSQGQPLAPALHHPSSNHTAITVAQAERPALVVQLPPGPPARSIGLRLAARLGYFDGAGVDVTLQQAAIGQSPAASLADGQVDLAIDILPVALRARADGANIVHVAQFFQHATLMLACRPEIDQPGKLAGENIGVWLGGWESSFYAWLNRLGLSYFASGGGVTVLRQGVDAEMFLANEVDCMTTTSYLAPLHLAPLGPARSALVSYGYEELGLGVLEDGLYARADDLADPARVDAYARFLAGALRGWQAARDDVAAARKLLASLSENADIDPLLLNESLTAVNAAVAPEDDITGRLDLEAYDRSVNLLLTGAPEPLLKAAPDGAVSDLVFKRYRAIGPLDD
jgi:NitT/TauT family transport system substrate-binding protein